jgi:flagellin-specific chaperone FliS
MTPTSSEAALHYSRFQIQTASHPKRICMLHARCADLVLMAGGQEDAAKRRLYLDKAQNIMSQLMAVLRIDDAVANGLYFLYDTCYVLLNRGNEDDCRHAHKIVSVLRDTFEQLLRTV